MLGDDRAGALGTPEGRYMNKISRREALGGIVAAAAILGTNATGAEVQETLPAAFRGDHVAKPLPFDAAKLNGISEKLIRSHHENNYTERSRR